MFDCPVCGYPNLQELPEDSFEICPSCGTEFGYQDATSSHAELRRRWMKRGAQWHSRSVQRPQDWDAKRQVMKAGLPLPEFTSEQESKIDIVLKGEIWKPPIIVGTAKPHWRQAA
jgi:hypothetical protein